MKNAFTGKRTRMGVCTTVALALLGIMPTAFAQSAASPADKSATKAPGGMAAQPMPMSPQKKDAGMTGMSGMAPMSAADSDMRASMMGMMKSMDTMKSTGDTDHDFAMMMKMHHQGAIDMAQMELKGGKDATMRSMAKRIIAAQQREIRQFDQWLAKKK
ncbi:MAG: DUF305 domain-containing protein [Paracoccaceae bacterium]